MLRRREIKFSELFCNTRCFGALLSGIFFLAGCTNETRQSEQVIEKDNLVTQKEITNGDNRETITIRGTRISVGNAVECTKVRGENGIIHSVSYLEPAIAIGDQVELTGFMANVTECVGKVIYVEKAIKLGN